MSSLAEPEGDLAAIRALVAVAPLDDSTARGATDVGADGPSQGHHLYGGLMISQSLAACAHTVPEAAVPDTLHVELLGTGSWGRPIDYRVERVRDGRALQHRDVRGFQGGEPVVHATVVASVPVEGVDWQADPRPPAGPPDGPGAHPSWAARLGRGYFDVVSPASDRGWMPVWVRSRVAVGDDDPWLHAAVVAFWSDFGLNGVARETHDHHGGPTRSVSASHSMWFHRHSDLRGWHLLDAHTTTVAGNQGLVAAGIWSGAGALVASVSQSVFVRRPPSSLTRSSGGSGRLHK